MREKYFWREFSSTALNQAAPSQVVGEVVGCDTIKAADPLLEARVVGIDVLDVKHLLADVLTGRHMD